MRNVRDYAVITASYWAFTLTDGALRMLVLLFLNEQGYTPVTIASLFLFYEFFGIVTNLTGGWLGARFGLKSTLFAGLSLQIVATCMLGLGSAWISVPYVMVAQAISGVAKDLTKMSSKSYIKLVVPSGDRRGLMRWVAILTGSKNTLKGAGFFLGGLLLTTVGFRNANLGMAAGLAVALVAAFLLLPRAPGKAKTKPGWRAMFSKDARINWLSAARFFLFGARDIWFVLALPIFFANDLGWDFHEVGGFLALWVIGYGLVQAFAPAFVKAPGARGLATWTGLLLLPLAAIVLALMNGAAPAPTLTIGLAVFGAVFATNSAVHSYLIVHYAEEDKVSLAVGFYYMANAGGRLVGTLLSGALFQAAGLHLGGLTTCIVASILFVFVSFALGLELGRVERRVHSAAP